MKTAEDYRREHDAAKTEAERLHVRLTASHDFAQRDLARFEERHPELRNPRF